MNRSNNLLTITLLTIALLFPIPARAMTIQQFDKMAMSDQVDYIADLIEGAQKVLTNDRKPGTAAQVKQLFTTKNAGATGTIGMSAFEKNLASLRAIDAKNAEKNPRAQRLEVEQVMISALKQHGIVLPKSFITVANSFKPKYPPQSN
jgi:hypothetical protein